MFSTVLYILGAIYAGLALGMFASMIGAPLWMAVLAGGAMGILWAWLFPKRPI